MRCINKRCNKEIGDYRFCPYCGKSQEGRRHTPKRANGTGSVYKRKDNKKRKGRKIPKIAMPPQKNISK